MDKEEIRELMEDVVSVSRVYFTEGNLTTSDFQGCLEAIINRYSKK